MESKNKKGVSHIVIVITILVLCVLAATVIITLSSSMKGKKLIETETENVDGVERSKYIGYFADVDGDGTVDGVIFADLAYSASGEWNCSYDTFSYEAETGFKNYEIVEESYSVDGAPGYGTKPVLKATGRGKDRFYVMALSNITQSTDSTKDDNYFTWYDSAFGKISDYSTVTSKNFGTGKTNTETMLKKWNDAHYGTKNADTRFLDVWGVIQDKVEDGWFVPSRAEWSAFGNAFGLTDSNCERFRLYDFLWSSSLNSARSALGIMFSDGSFYRLRVGQLLLRSLGRDFLIL